MFSNGMTLFGHLRVPVTPFGLPGHQSLEGAYTSGRFSPFSQDDYVILEPARESRDSTVGLVGGHLRLRSVPLRRPRGPDQGLGDLREHQPRRSGHQPGPLVPEPRGRRHQPAARPVRGLVGRGLLLPGDQQTSSGRPSGPSRRAATSRASSSTTTPRSPVGSPCRPTSRRLTPLNSRPDPRSFSD